MSNPFLNYGNDNITLESLSNGTGNININSAQIQGLDINLPVVTDSDKKLSSSLILQNQVYNLVSDLSSKVNNPLTTALNCNGNNINNCPNVLSNPFTGTINATADIVATYNTTPISLITTSSTASSAQSTANTANTTANNALTTANNALPKAGGTMTGDINLSSTHNLTNVNNITATTANVGTLTGYIKGSSGALSAVGSIPSTDVSNTTFLNLSGGTMTGDINLSSTHNLTNVNNITATTGNYGNISINTTTNTITGTSGLILNTNNNALNINNGTGNVNINGSGNLSLSGPLTGTSGTFGDISINSTTGKITTSSNNMTIQPVNNRSLLLTTTGTGQNILSGTVATSNYTGYLFGNGVSAITASATIPQANIGTGTMANALNMGANNINSTGTYNGNIGIFGALRINDTVGAITSTSGHITCAPTSGGSNILNSIGGGGNSLNVTGGGNNTLSVVAGSNILNATSGGNNTFNVDTGVNYFTGQLQSMGVSSFFNTVNIYSNSNAVNIDTQNNTTSLNLQGGGGPIISGGIITAPQYAVNFYHTSTLNAYTVSTPRFITTTSTTVVHNNGFLIGATGTFTPLWDLGISRRCRVSAMLGNGYGTAGPNNCNFILWLQISGSATSPGIGVNTAYGWTGNTNNTIYPVNYNNIVQLVGGTSYQFAGSVNQNITYGQTLSVSIESLLS